MSINVGFEVRVQLRLDIRAPKQPLIEGLKDISIPRKSLIYQPSPDCRIYGRRSTREQPLRIQKRLEEIVCPEEVQSFLNVLRVHTTAVAKELCKTAIVNFSRKERSCVYCPLAWCPLRDVSQLIPDVDVGPNRLNHGPI